MMTHHELTRIRRQMHQRIRLVITQRRLIAADPSAPDYLEPSTALDSGSAEPPPEH